MSDEIKKTKKTKKKPNASNRKIDIKGGKITVEDCDAGIDGDIRLTFPKDMSRNELMSKLEVIMIKAGSLRF